MNSVLDLSKTDLKSLNPDAAVDAIRELLWAEASFLGIGVNLINVPTAINVADGGIDADVLGSNITSGHGIIKPGHSRYQIKTGKISLGNDSHINSLLFSKPYEAKRIKPRIKSCLDQNALLVLIFFGYDDPETSDGDLINRLRAKLAQVDNSYSNARIEVWRQNNLLSFFSYYPSLIFKIKGILDFPFRIHQEWSRAKEMITPTDYIKSSDYQSKTNIVQQILRSTDRARHIRVLDIAGGGKTRFVLEATKSDDIASKVIYTKANRILNSPLLNGLIRVDNQYHLIIVVDECDHVQRQELWDALANSGPRVKLVTIYNESEDKQHDIDYCQIPIYEPNDIKNIIMSHGIPDQHIDRWVELVGDSPRFAHMVGINLKFNPDDILKPVDNIYDRAIAGYGDVNHPEAKTKKRVLLYLSLFKRFGYAEPFRHEAESIHRMIQKDDPNLGWARFIEIIEEFRQQYLLQGSNTLYITPNALHIWAWREWWNTHGKYSSFKEIYDAIPDGTLLRRWFYEMFEWAEESTTAQTVVGKLLNESDVFKNSEFLKKKGDEIRLFMSLTIASPEQALKYLSKAIGQWPKDKLIQLDENRWEIVWALERIVIWRHLFQDAARLLLALAETETDHTFSNNATGVFIGLFSPGAGKVAPTEASPEERFPILKEALESESKARRLLGLRACAVALESTHFSRMSGPEKQGLRKEPNLWQPKIWGELFDAYRRVWQYLRSRLDVMESDEKQMAVDTMVRSARGLIHMANLAPTVIETLEEFQQKHFLSKETLLEEATRILHYDRDRLAVDVTATLARIRDDLTGTGYSNRMKRYVKMELLEDKFDENREYVDSALPKIRELAEESLADPDRLKGELDWLFTDEAKRAGEFGDALGRFDEGFSLLPMLQDEFTKVSLDVRGGAFLGGYFHALRELDVEKWESLLDEYAQDDELAAWVADLTRRSGLTDRAARRMLRLAKEGKIKVTDFQLIHVKGITEPTIIECLSFLLSHSDKRAIYVAIGLFFWYYIYPDPKAPPPKPIVPEDLTFALLAHKNLFIEKDKKRQFRPIIHEWTEIAIGYIRSHPSKSLELAKVILAHFGEEGTILEGYHPTTQAVIDEIAKKYPQKVWSIVRGYLGPPLDDRSHNLRTWLRGEQGFGRKEEPPALTFFDKKLIYDWIDEDVESRAWLVATFVPKDLFREEQPYCTGRDLLVRYGIRVDVRRNFTANYYSEGFSGPGSSHYQRVKQKLLDYRTTEDDNNVIKWIDEYVAMIEEDIRRHIIDEERTGF